MSTNFIIAIAAIILLFLSFVYLPIGLWLSSQISDVKVSFIYLLRLRFRKVPPSIVINAMIVLKKAAISHTKEQIETLFLAGGDVKKVTFALIEAKQNGIKLSFEEAAKIEVESIKTNASL